MTLPAPRYELRVVLDEYDRALAYTDSLWQDLSHDEVTWRPHDDFSAIGWHLGHQAAVSHYMVRNLTAAEPPLDDELDRLMDGATPEPERGHVPSPDRLRAYRTAAAERLHFRMGNIDDGRVGAPAQLRHIAVDLVIAATNHEYQHSRWIGEVRSRDLGHELPERPASDLLVDIDGYLLIV